MASVEETQLFNDRVDAATQLAKRLIHYKGQHPLVVAIPRGAVPMARIIADELQGDLDVVLVAKIPAPLSPEFAIGSVTENGLTYIAEWAGESGATQQYIDEQVALLMKKMRDRRQQYTSLLEPISAKDRVVIVVDDGLATGATMLAALHSLRKMEPRLLVMAVPVASPRALQEVEKYADAVVCPLAPPDFRAVGQFYRIFSQVSDEEVGQALQRKH